MGVKTATKNDEYKQTAKAREIYSDFNHTFLPHPNTGQIARRVNVDAVKLAVRNLVLTNKYERLRNPEFGGNISHYLFEQLTPETGKEIEADIKWLIDTYEPRAKVLEVNSYIPDDGNTIDLTITFNVVMSKEVESLDITLYRVR